MLQHFGLSKKEVIYFEHNEKAVKSARKAGIQTCHYNPEKKDVNELKEFLIENL
jgi:FMN phosphatase YigB (HAD superfamily)